jgi:Flp pilus assembly protein TadD
LQLGQLQAARGNSSNAVAEVDRLLAKNPDFGPAHLLRAYFREAGGDTSGAIEGYRKCLEVFPEGDPAWAVAANNLAWLLAVRGGNLTEALSLAQRARQIDPENGSYADTLGWIYYLMGNYVLAVDQLEFAVNHGKQQPQHYFRLGLAYHKKGDAMRAKQSLRRALELSDSFEGAAEARRILQELG